jgi:nicotinate phosphoribosyltransferase
MMVLVDYFGAEITDSLAVATRLADLAQAGRLALRIDTPGNRYAEGLDEARSRAVLERRAPDALRAALRARERSWLIGRGVTAAAIHHLRQSLDEAGFTKVRIVASSGFSAAKCRVMGLADAPIDVVGTGSYLPEQWTDTYATADIIDYGGEARVKRGRESLLGP